MKPTYKNHVVHKTSGSGVTFSGLLTVLFIALKLTNVINWSWLWVLSPIWLPIAVIIGLLAFLGVLYGAISLLESGVKK